MSLLTLNLATVLPGVIADKKLECKHKPVAAIVLHVHQYVIYNV